MKYKVCFFKVGDPSPPAEFIIDSEMSKKDLLEQLASAYRTDQAVLTENCGVAVRSFDHWRVEEYKW